MTACHVRRAGNRRRCDERRGGAAGCGRSAFAPDRRAAAVSARPRRSGTRRPVPEPLARSSARPDGARRHARSRSIASWRPIARKERIAIHGDYDVDGVTSTVILRRALELLGGDVVHFIPERLSDGYGLQPAAIERLHADGVALVISVDCGIRGAEAARRARELGVDLIITDHHEPDAELPPALAVINPKRRDCTLSRQVPRRRRRRAEAGAGALPPRRARQLAARLRQDRRDRHARRRRAARRREPRHRQARARAALARARTRSACARCSTCRGLTGKTIDSYHIAFMLAPRVNAAGRMSTPDIATRLLLAERRGDGGRSARAGACSSTARTSGGRRKKPRSSPRRRRSCRPIPTSARARSSSSPARAGTAASSASSRRSWSTRSTGRRSCCRSTDGVAHGSCRSIPRFDMLGALERCAHLLIAVRRPQAGGRADDGRRRIQGAARGGQRRRRRDARARRPDAAAADRRRPDVPRDHRRRRGRRRVAGAVRRRQSRARCSRRAASRSSTARASSRSATSRWRSSRTAASSAPSPGARPSATTTSTEHKAALDVAFSLEQNQFNGETYVELTLSDARSAASPGSLPVPRAHPRNHDALAEAARIVMAFVAVAVCVAVGVTFKRRGGTAPTASLVRTDPRAVVESTERNARCVSRAATKTFASNTSGS